MNKLKSISVLFLVLVAFSGCKKNNSLADNNFYDKTFNWQISVPDDYEKVDLKQKADIKGDTTLAKKKHSIVVFKKDEANYFSVNYEDFFGSDVRALDLNMKLKDFLLLKDIGKIYPKGKMGDYSVSTENISGLPFRRAKIEITEDEKKVVTLVIFSRGFNDKIFVNSIVYEDEDDGKEMIDLFKKSTFKK
ncbi:hypothetical protein [Flavobacterium tistrianum]|uniref:hypothetical protein n=1 Tax=Flavobacterium tistrianum TaxID=1685414 RepID=UPI000DAD1236|nr:hypothetical protein [Flavobacterium tistrianum]KAF2339226.1 hypothetical protein DMB71_17215 [Flavobacterium tistrianum]